MSAAIASWATYRINVRTFEWLLVIAVDRSSEVGFLGRVKHGGNGLRIVGPREAWPANERQLFEEPSVVRALDPARAALPNMLRNGLDDAAKRRRRRARRS